MKYTHICLFTRARSLNGEQLRTCDCVHSHSAAAAQAKSQRAAAHRQFSEITAATQLEPA